MTIDHQSKFDTTMPSPRHDETAVSIDHDILGDDEDIDSNIGTTTTSTAPDIQESTHTHWKHGRYYNWRTHIPRNGKVISILNWLQTGFAKDKDIESDERLRYNLTKLATVLKLLREYYLLFGMPHDGGPNDQEVVLRELLKDLYAGGAPIWTLEKAIERGAEGLTGKKGVDVGMLPRKAFISTPSRGVIAMFRIQSGFDIQRLAASEKILVRIASFASNTHGFTSLPSRFPHMSELENAALFSECTISVSGNGHFNKHMLAKKILNLASRAEGLFFFINSTERPDTSVHSPSDNVSTTSSQTKLFWQIEDHISELFSRLATIEAMQMLLEADKKRKVLYGVPMKLLFRFMASAGACAFWFRGNWIDVIAAGCCGAIVGILSGWSVLSKEDRVVFETIASTIVGFIAGLLSCYLPNDTCFVAISLSGVLDILQGFRVVYSVIEFMGKHSVAGSADFLEGLLYTLLISFFLRVGELLAELFTGKESLHTECYSNIDEIWYILLVPAAAISWSGLFNPEYEDLPLMAFHGVLAFAISWFCGRGGINSQISLFLAAFGVTFSSGLISRFSGRQAMGNTVAGLYVLVPGAYIVQALFGSASFDFIGPVVLNAVIIGTGAWTGTIVCSPTIVGTTASRLRKGSGLHRDLSHHDSSVHRSTGAMLYF